jgi:hypothetical protein
MSTNIVPVSDLRRVACRVVNTVREGSAEEKGTFAALVDMAQDLGADDLAEQHDHYLYGTEKS